MANPLRRSANICTMVRTRAVPVTGVMEPKPLGEHGAVKYYKASARLSVSERGSGWLVMLDRGPLAAEQPVGLLLRVGKALAAGRLASGDDYRVVLGVVVEPDEPQGAEPGLAQLRAELVVAGGRSLCNRFARSSSTARRSITEAPCIATAPDAATGRPAVLPWPTGTHRGPAS